MNSENYVNIKTDRLFIKYGKTAIWLRAILY
jgi:hypothetical protein